MKSRSDVGRVYDWIGQKIHLDKAYHPIPSFSSYHSSRNLPTTKYLVGEIEVVLSLTEQDFSFQILLILLHHSFYLEYDLVTEVDYQVVFSYQF